LHRKDKQIFETILKAAENEGFIPRGYTKQIVDSTCTLGAGSVQDTYTLIRLAIRKLLKILR
jgi:hypothetical protein